MLTIWLATATALVSSRSSSSGVPTLTAMMISAPSWRATSMGRLRTSPPSTSGRPLTRSGANTPGTAIEARRALNSGVWSCVTMSPESRSVATARKGTGRARSGVSACSAGSRGVEGGFELAVAGRAAGQGHAGAQQQPELDARGHKLVVPRRRKARRSRAGRSARMAAQSACRTRAASSLGERPAT